VLIGTANLDNRSFRLNFELTIAMHCANSAAQVAAMLQRDIADSEVFDPLSYARSHRYQRALGRLFRLLAPLQ